MKTLFSLTTDPYDLARFSSHDEFACLLEGFDGVELMYLGDDTRGIVQKEQVVGFHLYGISYWYDLWKGDEKALLGEFGSLDACERYFGGTTRQALIQKMRAELEHALRYEAEYAVFHIADASIQESMTRRFRHSDEEIAEAACELINIIFRDAPPIKLLIENLWYPGFAFTRPDITRFILNSIHHKQTGIMLDTGHLLHTNTSLRSQEEGLRYIHNMLDKHGDLCAAIKGIHLNQSLSGEFAEHTKNNPPRLAPTFNERVNQLYTYIFQIDRHLPFTGKGITELVERISPEYLTFEFITSSLEEHKQFLSAQKRALLCNGETLT